MNWFCVWTHASKEQWAKANLLNQNFEVYLPEIGDSRHGLMPLFPRYLFAHFDINDSSWRKIPSTRGVVRLLGASPESPTPLPSGSIEQIVQDMEENKSRALLGISPGDKVRIVSGVLKGFSGICQFSRSKRVHILLDSLRRVTADTGSVERIG